MAAEEILNLFDSYWFEQEIFTKKPLPSSSSSPPQESNPVVEIHEEEETLKKISCLPSLHVRSLSDQNSSSKTSFLSDSLSPNSVLITTTTKLQTILSGKEVKQFSSTDENTIEVEEEIVDMEEAEKPKVMSTERRRRRTRRKKNGSSKSLTDLEFEELKGFMDLGFVFSEEDHKDSSLVSIIPGLQKMGRTNKLDKQEEEEDDDERVFDKSVVSRPYLSEAWDVLDQRKVKNPILMNWKVPALGNEVDMKDHLRFWAHTVASNVR